MHSPYESLFEAIVYQQLSGRAAGAILARVQALFGGGFPAPSELVGAKNEALRGAGLSRPKIAALRDLSAKALDGMVPDLATLARMGDEAIVERLVLVRGVGRWTVEMLLIFRLGRPDVLPGEDLGLRKGFAAMMGRRALPTPEEVERRGERWRPLRTVASWYLWRAGELERRGPSEVWGSAN
jgi:3-methyladenine DNA glycosylase/8-oxoguanine DNA glycosylase